MSSAVALYLKQHVFKIVGKWHAAAGPNRNYRAEEGA